MLETMSCWKVDWTAIGAIATAVASIIALVLGGLNFWWLQQQGMRRALLAEGMFLGELLRLHAVLTQLSMDSFRGRLISGVLPLPEELESLKIPLIKSHVPTLDVPLWMAKDLGELISYSAKLEGFCASLVSADDAARIAGTASVLEFQAKQMLIPVERLLLRWNSKVAGCNS